MNATNLAERYRPQTWSGVVGQSEVIKRVDVVRRRFGTLGGRAYFLSGPSGAGKTTIGRLIANEVAGASVAIQELDAGDVTSSFLDWAQDCYGYRPIGGTGWGFLINECHGLNRQQIRKLLTALEPAEGLPSYVTRILTTTVDGQDKLFDDCDDAGPLVSRCISFPLARRDLVKAFAERA